MASNEQRDVQDLHEYPTPGSAEARELGCACSAKRNNDGQWPPFAPGTSIGGTAGGWMMAMDCTLHARSVYSGAYVG